MATKIVTKNSSTAGAAPTATDLVQGELAVNVADGRLYTEDNAAAIVELGVNPATEITANAGIALPDSQKATFGTSDDLQIYHDTHSYIQDTGTGSLFFLTQGAEISLFGNTSAEYMGRFIQDGAVELYHNGAKKLATTSTGIDVTGTATMDGLTVETATGTATPTPSQITIATSSAGGDWSETDPWGRLAFYSADTSAGGAKEEATLDVVAAQTAGGVSDFFVKTYNSGLKNRIKVGYEGNVSFYEDTGTTPKFFWDASAESLGIGTTSPLVGLHVEKDQGSGYIAAFRSNNSSPYITVQTTGGITQLQGINSSFTDVNDIAMQTSGGRVGIGTSSPTAKATIEDGDFARLDLNLSNATGTTIADVRGLVQGTEKWRIGKTGSSSDDFAINVTGTERMRIDSSGNVNIASGRLRVASGDDEGTQLNAWTTAGGDGNLAAFNLVFNTGSNSARTERMRINSSGNVGIGTSSPVSELDVAGITPTLTIKDTQNKSWTSSDTTLGELAFRISDASGIGAHNVAFVRAVNDITSSSTPSGALSFGVAPNNSNASEAMRIDSSGNVGIGTSSPASVLDVRASGVSTPSTLSLVGTNSTSSDSCISQIKSSESSAGSGSSELSFHTRAVGGAFATPAERMRIDSSGNVGIGQSTIIGSAAGRAALTLGGSLSSIITFGNAGTRWGGIYASAADYSIFSDSLMRFEAGGSERMRIDSSGNLLVGTTGGSFGARITAESSTSYLFESRRTGTGSEGHVAFRNANGAVGTIFTNGTTTSYNTSSDQRLKENIADADDAGSKIDAIQVRQYDWKADGSHQDYGMIAQELQAVAPEAVSGDADSEEMMGVDYSKLVPMLIKEIQSLRNRVAQLETGE